MDSPLSYSSYLRLGELLDLQTLQSDLAGHREHDEMLFIVIHQVYELWFKQVLHEIDHVIELLGSDATVQASRGLRRVLTILKVMVSQMDVLETMSPMEFLSFRERLESSSGFQSAQFREFEFVLGHKRRDVLTSFADDEATSDRLRTRLSSPSLWFSVCEHLRRSGLDLGARPLIEEATSSNEDVQEALIEVYRSDHALADLCEKLVDLDEGVQEWRYRHVKMVERTIGHKQGSGGSSGVAYLASTLGQPVFPDLWAIRSRL
ncbi:MAG: tryptophan 2,3-dioxygenase family protein [Actinomycetota bacterium]|nr:tryptophan 2,3-dioxygenase family protein [Actinomycetota bacterium]MDA2970977.1 tryptophan 2,3-dioxygenase family protein [Actinomycetota bacterium]MDA3001972.1 tryptophan 2,3-dioxygenase family protein [Actinomycetota bacterium]